jgi:hypothetical protein
VARKLCDVINRMIYGLGRGKLLAEYMLRCERSCEQRERLARPGGRL